MIYLFSKEKKEVKPKKGTSKKVKRTLKNLHSSDEESADESVSNIKEVKGKERHVDNDHVSSEEEEVDISRGEGDVQSSSDDEDEGNPELEIIQVWI